MGIRIARGLYIELLHTFKFFLLLSRTKDDKSSPTHLESASTSHTPKRSSHDDTRYVSIETMSRAQGGKTGEIDDFTDSIDFNRPRSQFGGGNSSTGNARNTRSSAAMSIDIGAASGGTQVGAGDAYDYIDPEHAVEVDYFKQMGGSEPGSPEVAGALSTSPVTHSNETNKDTDEAQVKYENLIDLSSTNNPKMKDTESSNEQYSNMPTRSVQQSGDSQASNCLETPTKENGYGKGAIPKRPKESYYQLWGAGPKKDSGSL